MGNFPLKYELSTTLQFWVKVKCVTDNYRENDAFPLVTCFRWCRANG